MSKKLKTIEGAGGGGGCFPAGTLVNTPSGYKVIETLGVGDFVYAFDLKSFEPGEIELPGKIAPKEVTQLFTHTFGEVGYTSPLLVITHEKGELTVTGNHYILTPSKQSKETDEGFARADLLEVGDTIYTEYGEASLITSVEAGEEYDFVYNLEVADLHTYIAGKVRVHNGGGGKSSHTAVQAPNSIRTNQIARVLLCPGEGYHAGGVQSVAPPHRDSGGNRNPEAVHGK